jgi:hypothetical protein
VNGTLATPLIARATTRRWNCQPASGSNRSSVTRTGPDTGGPMRTPTRTVRPGADCAEDSPLMEILARVIVRAARWRT